MDYEKAWYYVEINKNQNDSWVDHLGNSIDELVFDKKHRASYKPGHYSLKSFGELNRKFGDIPDNPLQTLTDWTISVESVYSNGSFSTVDLFYHLEAVNEEHGKSFDIIGCDAFLFQTDGNETELVFKGSVESVSSEGKTTAVSFSERIGSPTIEASENPIFLGNYSGEPQYWPVSISKDETGHEFMVLSQTPLVEFNGIFLYSEKRSEYIFVEFDNYTISSDKTRIDFSEGGDKIAGLNRDISIGYAGFLQDFLLSPGFSPIRPDDTKIEPDIVLVGNEGKEEIAYAWTSQSIPTVESYATVPMGRSMDMNLRKTHSAGEPIRAMSKKTAFKITLVDRPISITETGNSGQPEVQPDIPFPRDWRQPYIRGNPLAFLAEKRENLKTSNDLTFSKYDYPEASFDLEKIRTVPMFAKFSFKYADMDLPSEAVVEKMHLNIFGECEDMLGETLNYIVDDRPYMIWVRPTSGTKVSNSFVFDFSKDHSTSGSYKVPFGDTQVGHICVEVSDIYGLAREKYGILRLYALRLKRTVEIPFDGAKLFASGIPFYEGYSKDGDNFIVPAIHSLISATKADPLNEYKVRVEGKIPNTAVNLLLLNESVQFRDKLRNLALASSTFIRFDSRNSEFVVAPFVNMESVQTKTIGMEHIVLKGNIYDLSMRTPMKDQIYSGVQITWGKNIATGKYEHTMLVSELGIRHDGELQNPETGNELGWDSLIRQLAKNSNNGIRNLKTVENEWVRDKIGAERMAYNMLKLCCAPVRRAQVSCIKQRLGKDIDLGTYVNLDIAGYPEKLARTAWMVTAMIDNLDSCTITLELLEVWNITAIGGRYILTEDRKSINVEDGKSRFILESF